MMEYERKALEVVAEVLDKHLGDSDLTHFETDEDIQERAPVQWACSQINKLLQARRTEERTPHLPPIDADVSDSYLRAMAKGVTHVLGSTPLVVAQYAYDALHAEIERQRADGPSA